MLSRLISRLTGRAARRSSAVAPEAVPPGGGIPVPDGICSIIGDVHGCAGALARLLPQLPGRIFLVGDIIDRGEESAAVIDMLMARPDLTCLMGNHERMLLDFLADPAAAGPAWLRYGGLQTLASFGIGGDLKDLAGLRDRLAAAMGPARIAWLGALPLYHVTGNVAITHAGADPARPLEGQSRSLLWGHEACGSQARIDGLWIVQGHVILPAPEIAGGVIRIDTGAYAGGALSAAVLGDGPVRFIATR